MKKTILYLLLLVVVIVPGTAWYMWNKPHRSIDHTQTTPIDANILVQSFEKNEIAANQKYLNKPLTVTGVVGEVSVNGLGQQVIFIKGTDDFSGVQCTLKDKDDVPNVGDTIKISGFCNGYTVAVILDDCKLVNKK